MPDLPGAVLVDDVLAAIASLRASIAARADEIEQQRHISPDLIAALTAAGCYRFFSPEWRTGAPTRYGLALAAISELAMADASVAWVVSQSALGQLILAYLPAPALETLYHGGPDVRIAGVFAPKGHASQGDGNWTVSGRWPLASGSDAAQWIYVQALVTEGRRVVRGPGDQPLTRLVLLPRDEVTIIDTWDAVGLRGTASHDIQVEARQRDEHWTCEMTERDGKGEGLQSVPLMDHAGLLIAAVAVGCAAGALDEVARIAASGKRPAFSPRPLASDPVFHVQLGVAHMQLASARALLEAQGRLIECASQGRQLSVVEGRSVRATCHHIAGVAAAVVDTAYTLARSASIGRTSPLQRRLRDMHTLTQHAWCSSDFPEQLGATLVSAAVSL